MRSFPAGGSFQQATKGHLIHAIISHRYKSHLIHAIMSRHCLKGHLIQAIISLQLILFKRLRGNLILAIIALKVAI